MLLPNGPDYVIADQAIARIGAARVALTEMLSAKEVSHCLTDCGATVAIAGSSMIDAGAGSGSDALHTIIAVGGAQPGDGGQRAADHADGRRHRRDADHDSRFGPRRGRPWLDHLHRWDHGTAEGRHASGSGNLRSTCVHTSSRRECRTTSDCC